MTRMTLEEAEAHQRRVMGLSVDNKFHVPQRSKHRPCPNTVLISQAVKAKKSKFKNIRCQAADGTNFASCLERDYYNQLLLRWKAGDVLWFTRQVPFWLEGGVKFVVDFMVIEPGTPEVSTPGIRFVDTTGVLTQTKKNKLKQLKSRYGIDVQLVGKV